jgi:hypothetical protein
MMTPFDVTYREVPDERLSELLAATNAVGFATPVLTPAGGGPAPDPDVAGSQADPADPFEGDGDLPETWQLVREMDGQAYSWPEEREAFDEYRVYAGETQASGTVHIALGKKLQRPAWDSDRVHVVAFLTRGSPQIPLAEFQGTDDFDQTRELIAIIRGQGGLKSKKMFGPADPLPNVYTERFRTALYSDRIQVRGAWAKFGVVAREDEPQAMLDHALIQARRRGDL